MLRWLSCLLQMCPHVPRDDDTGCWGECIHCGKRSGFVSRAELRAYADREYAKRLNQQNG